MSHIFGMLDFQLINDFTFRNVAATINILYASLAIVSTGALPKYLEKDRAQ